MALHELAGAEAAEQGQGFFCVHQGDPVAQTERPALKDKAAKTSRQTATIVVWKSRHLLWSH
jgi:alkanesulfonate monooxygenase SsuD/methylene tetrahydromethanopterin reductase-like flavin-dependent oxidoreductase (luciferase family)